jgi:phage/plasmid-associated DNA primase
MGMFKRLTGGDPIHAEVTFEEPMKFTNHATVMFACNEMPVLADDTRGNWRRWQLIKFPYVFSDNDPDAKAEVPKEDLYDRLFTDEEFSGLLTRCVQEISEWDDGRAFFPTADSWETTRSKMRRAAEPVYDFAHTCLQPSDDEEAYIPKDTLRQAYQRYATENGLTKLGPEQFGRRLLGLQDFNIEDGRTRKEGGRITVYKGVNFTGRGREILNGNADPDDERQSGLEEAAGKQARVDRVKEVLRDHDGGEMQKTELYGKLGDRFDIGPEHAKAAVTDAAEQGVIIDAGGGLIRPNW